MAVKKVITENKEEYLRHLAESILAAEKAHESVKFTLSVILQRQKMGEFSDDSTE